MKFVNSCGSVSTRFEGTEIGEMRDAVIATVLRQRLDPL